MFKLLVLKLFPLIFQLIHPSQAQQIRYVPPEALIEPLKPSGIRISIPHEEGVSLVAFHVKFNEEFNGLEAGTIARDIIHHSNDRWTYEDKSTKLRNGDIIYYWIHVVYEGLGYDLVNQKHTVIDFYDSNGQRIELDNDKTSDKQSCILSTATKVYNSIGLSARPCAGQILLYENFKNFNHFLGNNWTIVEEFPSDHDSAFVVYRNSHENVIIENGLKITPQLLRNRYHNSFIREGNLTLDKCTANETDKCFYKAYGFMILRPISSGRITTKKSLHFQYGHIEIKAKFPRGDWLYPHLALLPVKDSSEEQLQIRIASAVGNTELKSQDGRDISGHALWGGITRLDSNNAYDRLDKNRTIKYNKQLWSDDYHTFELIWNPNRMILKVDQETYEDREINLPANTSFYLSIGLSVGGVAEFPDDCKSKEHTKPWRNGGVKALLDFFKTTDTWYKTWLNEDATSLNVKYVKVWAI